MQTKQSFKHTCGSANQRVEKKAGGKEKVNRALQHAHNPFLATAVMRRVRSSPLFVFAAAVEPLRDTYRKT